MHKEERYYRVGISNYRRQIQYEGKSSQTSIANISVSIACPHNEEKAPLSSITQKIADYECSLNTPWSLEELVYSIYDIHQSDITITMRIPLAFPRISVCSNIASSMVYDCVFALELYQETLIPHLCTCLPLVTVCPCSLSHSISKAHMQRVYVSFCLNSDASLYIEDAISLLEGSASEKTYPIIKQVDEKVILENAYNKACLVEDVIKHMASSLHNNVSIEGYRFFVQSFESLHPHNMIGYRECNYQVCSSVDIYNAMQSL